MNIETLINKNNSKFSKSDNKISSFIINQPQYCANLTLKRFSTIMGISSTTILRFCKKIGLSGYSELKFILKKEKDKKTTEKFSETQLFTELTEANNQVLEEFKKINSNNIFEDIKKCKNIYIFYLDSSQYIVANYLAHKLIAAGKKVIILNYSSFNLICKNSYLETGDVLIFLLNNKVKKFKNIFFLKKIISNKQLVTIAITDTKNNLISSTLKYIFYLPLVKYPINSLQSNFQSLMTPIYYFIDLITGQYSIWRNQNQNSKLSKNLY